MYKETIKKLTIIKKKQFSRTNVFIQNSLSRLISKLSLISRPNLLFPFVKIVNSSKDEMLMQFKRWLRIALFFDGLVFLNLKGDIPICSLDPWKYSVRRNVNSDFSIVTMRRVAIIFFELGVVKNSMQKF